MQSFLREAEQKQSGDQRVQQWVFEINSIANEAVAILETYSFEVGKGASRLKACTCICWKEKKLYNVAEEIQSLKQRIMDISRKRETYGITNINSNAGEGPSNQVRKLRRTTSYVDDQDNIFVGLKDVVQKLLAELLKAEPRRRVVSIHGMGGLGKTTLARNLYNSPNIVSSFPTRAWICVSQEYNTMDLLKNIIKSIQGRTKGTLEFLERMTESDLEIYLRDLLKEGKYLVVVDDVWQREAWESLKRAFPDSKNGSRVIITTRKHDVAERADNRGFVYSLRFLSREESWDLFCRKQLDVRAMVPEMVRIARDMVEKCRGLPLAIVVLSGLLSHKRGLDEWQKVKDHFWQNIQDDSIEISYILSLSYNDLSATLKQCFLYFGIFPEDQEVDAEKIILLWMAEGLIPNGEERIEDVAEGFLNELIRRSLIQELQKLWLRGKIEKLPLFPNSITMMVLWNSKLMEDPMPSLGMLPNLRNLELEEAYEGKEITCSDNSFSQLEFLRLHCLDKLETWHLSTSAMPSIKGLDIKHCPHLYHIPKRMQDVEITPFWPVS
ncbi:hypothetical protein R3W88_010923 [Solanum pinnatisectum]|uniref:Uncharacterized protein n=1 Tax=Solanum pinnatisectum TaxID=50273 RepID=A0AAV9L706_9SOLN|nr:hypothetical protein R3W88_010923 [Solanum pinnatisectum]